MILFYILHNFSNNFINAMFIRSLLIVACKIQCRPNSYIYIIIYKSIYIRTYIIYYISFLGGYIGICILHLCSTLYRNLRIFHFYGCNIMAEIYAPTEMHLPGLMCISYLFLCNTFLYW